MIVIKVSKILVIFFLFSCNEGALKKNGNRRVSNDSVKEELSSINITYRGIRDFKGSMKTLTKFTDSLYNDRLNTSTVIIGMKDVPLLNSQKVEKVNLIQKSNSTKGFDFHGNYYRNSKETDFKIQGFKILNEKINMYELFFDSDTLSVTNPKVKMITDELFQVELEMGYVLFLYIEDGTLIEQSLYKVGNKKYLNSDSLIKYIDKVRFRNNLGGSFNSAVNLKKYNIVID